MGAGIELLTGLSSGMTDEAGDYPQHSVLGHAQLTLQSYRRACQESHHPKPERKHTR